MNVQLGSMHAASFATDPKHLAFVLARYHFVARMLQGQDFVLEVGCGDGTGARIVRAAVNNYVGIDIESYVCVPGHDYAMVNILDGPLGDYGRKFTAAFALDVLEHIDLIDEDIFFRNINASLEPNGTVIIGTPSAESQIYASELSKLHHCNCKTGEELRSILQKHYRNVFL